MFHTTRYFGGLNTEQRHALRTSGFLLINAVAGSGKTTMLVALLLKSLMEDRDEKGNPVRLDRFALITFTRKAAANLRKKIRDAMEAEMAGASPETREFWDGHLGDLPGAAIGTIDSIVQDRLRRLAMTGVARFDPAIEVLDEVGRKILAERAVRRVMEQGADNPETSLGQALKLLGENHRARDISGRYQNLLGKDGDGETAARTIGLLTDGRGGYEQLEAMLSNPARDEWSRIWLPLAGGVGARLAMAVAELAGRNNGAVRAIQAIHETWNPDNAHLPEQFANLRDALFNGDGHPRTQGLALNGLCYSESLAALQADILPAIAPFDRMVFQTENLVFAENNSFQLYRAWGEFFLAAHQAYLEECRAENRYSFHDLARMLERELSILEPSRLREAGLPFGRVMIDEFQDNTSIQWRIGCRIAGGNPDDPGTWNRLTVVGDPEQAIYHWRGSNAQLMADVRRQYEESKPPVRQTWYDTVRGTVGEAENDRESTAAEKIGIGQLALNFRTRAATLERIDRCSSAAMGHFKIPHVPLASGEELRAKAGRPNTNPRLAELLVLPETPVAADADGDGSTEDNDGADKGYDPASLGAVASRLRMLHDENGLEWRDMLVLARGFTKISQPMHEVFRRAGIPYRAMIREAIWDSQEVRDVLNLARCLADSGNGPALLGVLRGPVCRLTDSEIVLLSSWCPKGSVHKGLAMVGAGSDTIPETPAAQEAWNHLSADRKAHLRAAVFQLGCWRRLVDRMPHHELLRMALDESGAFQAMAAWLVPEGTGAEAARRVAAGVEFALDRAREIEQSRPLSMAELSTLLDLHAMGEIRENIDPDLSEDEDMVRVMTIHASKGLEAKAVALLVPELGKNSHDRPRGTGMIILDRQFLRPDVSAATAAPYLGLPLMDLRGPHEMENKNQPPSLYRIARGTDNSHYEREEARLFHVAITRSEGALIVAAPRATREKDSRHWPIAWARDHLDRVDAAALPAAVGMETPCPRDLPPARPSKAQEGRVAIAATRLQDIMELGTREKQVEALNLARRGLQEFPAGVPKELLQESGEEPKRAGLGKVVGTLAHRALEMMSALPAGEEERRSYLTGQARDLLSGEEDEDEPGEGPRVPGEAEKAAATAQGIIARLDLPSHERIRDLVREPGAAEVDFALPIGDHWLVTGRFDRLLDNGEVVDWKTDRGDPDEIRDRYRGQMGLYALAVSEARRLRGEPEQAVRVSLALLSTGEVIPLDYSPGEIQVSMNELEKLLAIP